MKSTTIKRFSIVCAYLALIFSAAPAVSACETSNDLIFTRAYTLIQSRQLDEAQQLLNRLLNPSNPRPEVLNNLAAIAQLMDKWEDALILVSQAPAQSPSYASINTNHKLISSSRHFPLQLIEKLPCKEDAQGSMDITQAIDIATKARKARYQSKLTSRPIDHLPEQKSALLKAPLSKDESIEFDSDDLQTAKLVTPPKSFKTSANEANEKIKTLDLTVQQWAKAWQEKSVNEYLNFYAGDFNFASTGAKSRAEWESTRRERLSRYKSIKLILTNIHYKALSGDVIQVRFNQKWSGDSKVIRTPGKIMKWRLEQGQWQIIS